MRIKISFASKRKSPSRCESSASCHVKALFTLLLASVRVGRAGAATNLNLAYASVSQAQRFALYVPATSNGPLPHIIRIHGGAFSGGDKSSEASSVPALQARSYAVASLN